MGSIPSSSHGVTPDEVHRNHSVSSPPNRTSLRPQTNVSPIQSPSIVPNQASPPARSLQQAPLPPGWEMRTDKFGRPYFLDHVHKRTTFVDPRVPPGWEMQLDQAGRPYFIDHINKRTTWQDPRLLPGWEIQLDHQGRPYYIDHVNKKTTYTDPSRGVAEANLPPLPNGWEMRYDPSGKPVYIDNLSFPKRTTYERPTGKEDEKKPVEQEKKEGDSGDAPPASATEQDHNPPVPAADNLDDSKVCIICLEHERCVALVPCGHLCLCRECCGTQTKCPVCRTPVTNYLRTYMV